MERLDKAGLAYYHSLIRDKLNEGSMTSALTKEEINQIVLNTTSSEAAFLTEFDNLVSDELNDIIYGTDTTNS